MAIDSHPETRAYFSTILFILLAILLAARVKAWSWLVATTAGGALSCTFALSWFNGHKPMRTNSCSLVLFIILAARVNAWSWLVATTAGGAFACNFALSWFEDAKFVPNCRNAWNGGIENRFWYGAACGGYITAATGMLVLSSVAAGAAVPDVSEVRSTVPINASR